MLVGDPAFFVVHPSSDAHGHEQNRRPGPPQKGLFGAVHGFMHTTHQIKDGRHRTRISAVEVTFMNVEERLEQVATVINQIDDPKVPRNIRRQAKEACENWLLNKGKKLDVRIAMAQSKLEELYEDPNIPPEFGTLILTINTELERILREVL